MQNLQWTRGTWNLQSVWPPTVFFADAAETLPDTPLARQVHPDGTLAAVAGAGVYYRDDQTITTTLHSSSPLCVELSLRDVCICDKCLTRLSMTANLTGLACALLSSGMRPMGLTPSGAVTSGFLTVLTLNQSSGCHMIQMMSP